MPPWHVQENKWRASRYGLDAEIIVDGAGRERLVTDDLTDWLNRLEPVARRLGCADDLALVEVADVGHAPELSEPEAVAALDAFFATAD